MRIYLDNCVYNRPYDDFSGDLIVSLEAQAKLYIQEQIRDGQYELVTSEILMTEIDNCPFDIRRKGIMDFLKENSSIHVGPNNNRRLDKMAREIMAAGVKYKDAYHVASALIGECRYFISTDKRLLKYKTERISMVDPIRFITEMEEHDDDE